MRGNRARRLRWWHAGAIVALVAIAAVVAVFIGSDEPVSRQRQGPPGTGPLTLVTLGDSTLSGEGTGIYEPGTDGQGGNWCHRSPHSAAHNTSVPGITKTINLACSGAPTAHLRLEGYRQYGEPSQSKQLARLVKTHRVAAVVIAIGANDEPRFSRHVTKCAKAWFGGTPCSPSIARNWQSDVDVMVPKAVRAIRDVRGVLARAGYRQRDYQMVLLSYASPVSPDIPENLRSLAGCPFRTEDLRWIKEDGVRVLNDGLRRAADTARVRFLDMSHSGDGHEACTGGSDPRGEWFSRLTVRFDDFREAGRASHAATESFHPNRAGHAQVGRCVTAFLGTTHAAGACVPGPDGNLHAVTPSRARDSLLPE